MFLASIVFAYFLHTAQSSDLHPKRIIDFCQSADQDGSQGRCYRHFLRLGAAGSDPSDDSLCECSVNNVFSCGTNVYKCKSCFSKGITSPDCQECIKGAGKTCCACIAKAVGLASKTLGDGICTHCSKGLSSPAPTQNDNYAGLKLINQTCASQADKGTCMANLARKLYHLALMNGFKPPPKAHTIIVTPGGETVPVKHHMLGCSFMDIVCHAKGVVKAVEGVIGNKCDLCKAAVPKLASLGGVAACSTACVGIVEVIGGGPLDPIVDAVAFACVPICQQVFAAGGNKAADVVCQNVKLC